MPRLQRSAGLSHAPRFATSRLSLSPLRRVVDFRTRVPALAENAAGLVAAETCRQGDLPTWTRHSPSCVPSVGISLCATASCRTQTSIWIAVATATGIWFDKNEWDVLVARNLHDKVNQFFTQSWQARLRAEEARTKLDRLYLERFGAGDYARIKEVRHWLQITRSAACCWLSCNQDDPYVI